MNQTELTEIVTEVTKRVLQRIPASEQQKTTPACSSGVCEGCGACVLSQPEAVKSILDMGACRISSSLGITPAQAELARVIDHTILKPEATARDVKNLCAEAAKYCFASVCVNPAWVSTAVEALKGTGVPVCTVVGFPLGATTSKIKAEEACQARGNGALEFDMVINVGRLKGGEIKEAYADILAVRKATEGLLLKVIIETALLTDEEKVIASTISREAGADFVKTSTGFSKGGATAEDISLMRRTVGPGLGVKASGGIRSESDAREMIAAGATRIGASASVKIVGGK